MPNFSSKTVPIATRISVVAHAIILRRANRRGLKVSEYIRERIETDALRRR